MPNVFNSVKPQAHPSHNAFDLSHRDVFSAKPGMLTPMFVQHTLPEATYRIKHDSIMRTSPIQVPAFTRFSENYEYFFVPYSQIWKDFEKFYYERGDIQRNFLNTQTPSVPTELPRFDLGNILLCLGRTYFTERIIGNLYDDVLFFKRSEIGTTDYNRIQSNINSLKYHLLTVNNYVSNGFVCKDIHNRFCSEDCLRLLDLLGYGNYLPYFKQHIDSLFVHDVRRDADDNDYLTSPIMEDGTYSNFLSLLAGTESYSQSIALTYMANLWQDFDNGDLGDFITAVNSFNNIFPTIFSLAAYLKVWSDYYRNSQFDNDNYAYFYNFDYVVNNSQITIPTNKVLELLKPRYRQWKKDRFTGIFPNAQFGSVAVASLSGSSLISVADTNYQFDDDAVVVDDHGNLTVDSTPRFNYWNVGASVSAIAIRESLALQRYKERILRAGNRLTSLQSALFGDKSRFIENNYCDLLHAEHSGVDINSVASTADSGSSQVGELAANGVGVHNGNSFDFHSHDFGIILGLYYVLPELEYNNYLFEPFNQKSEAFDFFKPDLENLGLQAIYSFDIYLFDNEQDEVFGYLPRYWEYKTAIDLVHGEFYSHLNVDVPNKLELPFAKGAFAQYVTPRNSISLRNGGVPAFYVDVNCVDNIWYSNLDERQSSDCFLVNSYHSVNAILPMSVLGLPQL